MQGSQSSWIRLSVLAVAVYLGLPACSLAQEERKFNPPFKLPDNVELKRGLVYGRGGSRDLQLDLFLRRESSERRPAVVYVHGGSWREGDRSQFHRQAAYLASKGYVGACITYRLSGEAIFPAELEDCKCAVRWLRANAQTYGIDPDKIAVCGASAGGHLASLLGVTSGIEALEGNGGHAGFSSGVRLVVAFNGVFDLAQTSQAGATQTEYIGKFLGATLADNPEIYKKASPVTYVNNNSPPHLLLHGTEDTLVPIAHARAMVKKLKDTGVKVEVFEAEGAIHGFFNHPPLFEPALKRLEKFLDENLRNSK